MQWTDDLAVNIKLIDEDHKEIIRRMNDVVEAGKMGKPAIIERSLQMLADFCTTHFSNEENLQLRGRCPNYENHHHFHTIFLKEVYGFLDEVQANGVSQTLTQRIHDLIESWLIDHIKFVDRNLAKHLFSVNVLE